MATLFFCFNNQVRQTGVSFVYFMLKKSTRCFLIKIYQKNAKMSVQFVIKWVGLFNNQLQQTAGEPLYLWYVSFVLCDKCISRGFYLFVWSLIFCDFLWTFFFEADLCIFFFLYLFNIHIYFYALCYLIKVPFNLFSIE